MLSKTFPLWELPLLVDKHLSVRQLILHRISCGVIMYVRMYVCMYVCVTLGMQFTRWAGYTMHAYGRPFVVHFTWLVEFWYGQCATSCLCVCMHKAFPDSSSSMLTIKCRHLLAMLPRQMAMAVS